MPTSVHLMPGRVRIGIPDDTLSSLLQITAESNSQCEIQQWQFSNDTSAATHDFRKSRGTYATRADAQSGDRIIDIRGLPRSGASEFVFSGGAFRSYVDGTFTSGQNPPSRLVFETNLANASSQEQAAIFSNGFMVLGNAKVARGVGESLGLLSLGGNSTVEAYLERASADTSAARLLFRKTRGTLALPGDTANQDIVGELVGQGRSTSVFDLASLRIKVEGTVTAAQRPPSVLEFLSNVSNAAPTVKMIVDTGGTGLVGISNGLFSSTERPSAHLHILGEGAGDVHLHVEKCQGDATGPLFEGFKSRGTVATRANVALDDHLATWTSFGYSGSYLETAYIRMAVDAAVTNLQRPASRIEFWSNANNAAQVLNFVYDSVGHFRFGGAARLATTDAILPSDGHVISSDSGDNANHLYFIRASITNGPNITHRRMRGSFGIPANVVDGDRIGRWASAGWSGVTGWWDMARIDTFVEGAVVDNQRPGSAIKFYTNLVNAAVTERMQIDSSGNVGINTGSFGASSQGVLGIANRIAAPTGNPIGGGILFADLGAGKWRGSGGTTTTFGPADPHCPACGSDFGFEFERSAEVEPNPAKRYLAVCLMCLMDHLDSKDPAPKAWARKVKV